LIRGPAGFLEKEKAGRAVRCRGHAPGETIYLVSRTEQAARDRQIGALAAMDRRWP